MTGQIGSLTSFRKRFEYRKLRLMRSQARHKAVKKEVELQARKREFYREHFFNQGFQTE